MACNCTKKNKNEVYIYTDTKGHQQVYTSEVQAKAAKIRGGGGSIRTQAR